MANKEIFEPFNILHMDIVIKGLLIYGQHVWSYDIARRTNVYASWESKAIFWQDTHDEKGKRNVEFENGTNISAMP